MDNQALVAIAVVVVLFLLGIIIVPKLSWFQSGGKIAKLRKKVEKLQDQESNIEVELELRKSELELKTLIAARKKSIAQVNVKIESREAQELADLTGEAGGGGS